MRRIVLTFGLIAGGILSAVMLLALPFRDQIGLDRSVVIGYTSMVAAFLMVYFGIRAYRDQVAGGVVTFGRAVQVGALISLVATACYVATWELVFFKLAPDYTEGYTDYVVRKAEREGATAAELEATRRELAEFAVQYRKPLVNIAYTAMEPLPIALLFTLVSAGLLSRRRREARVVPA